MSKKSSVFDPEKAEEKRREIRDLVDSMDFDHGMNPVTDIPAVPDGIGDVFLMDRDRRLERDFLMGVSSSPDENVKTARAKAEWRIQRERERNVVFDTVSQLNRPWMFMPHTFAYHLSDHKWVPFDYLVFLSHVITAALAAGNARICIEVPPRHGKSWFISRWLPAWYLANWPEYRIILATYEANFAMGWGRQARDILLASEPEIGRTVVNPEVKAASAWETLQGGAMFTAGVGGPITGKGGNLLLLDDPHKNWKEAMSAGIRRDIIDWFDSTFYTRLEPGGSIIVLHTRWHRNDVIGYLLSQHQDNWIEIRFPAIAENSEKGREVEDVLGRKPGQALCPMRYNERALGRIRRAVGPRVWAGLYQQRPAAEMGNILQRDWWKFFAYRPVSTFRIQSWDTGFKPGIQNAWSACVTMSLAKMDGQVVVIIEDTYRKRLTFPALEREVISSWAKYKPNVVLIEDKASGISLIQSLRVRPESQGMIIQPVVPVADKETRALTVTPIIENGRTYLPKQSQAYPWVDEFIEICADFPSTEDKDIVDALTQGLQYFVSRLQSIGSFSTDMPRQAPSIMEGFSSGGWRRGM